VVVFLEQKLMTIQRGLQFALMPLLLDRHPRMFAAPCKKAMSCSLDSPSDLLSTSNTPNGEPSFCNNVHRAANAVLNKRVRRPKALLIFEVIRNNRLTGAQSIARRRLQVGPDACYANYTLASTDSGPNQKPVLGWFVFHDFAVFCTESFGCHACGTIKHADEAGALKRKDPQFSPIAPARPRRRAGAPHHGQTTE
jgi:hypothetical protein